PGGSLTVGEKPPVPPGSESTIFVPVDLTGSGDLDFLLSVWHGTNAITGVVRTSAVLINDPGYEVLAVPGTVEETPVWFPWPVPDRSLIPSNPSSPAAWRSGADGLVLLESEVGVEGHVLSAVGPLADREELFVAFRRIEDSRLRSGWLRLDGEAHLTEQGFDDGIYVVLGEPLPRWSHVGEVGELRTTNMIDVNRDGLTDFVMRSFEAMGYGGSEWIEPLRRAKVARPGYEPGDAIGPFAAGPAAWSSDGVTVWDCCEHPFVFSGFLGLWFEAQDGGHFAWWFGEWPFEFPPEIAYEPRPGVPIIAGEVPLALGSWVTDGDLVLSWNAQLEDHALQSTPSLEHPIWTDVSAVGKGRAVLPLDGVARFFRLLQESEPAVVSE
ncbi:MAG: hypothetical protein KDM81_13150, partial [Verrucomicrobiae bacterium]|nr:hypothetical protein [Verrucomicrobiae bacterium]